MFKKTTLAAFLLLAVNSLLAQNLVSNPGFEIPTAGTRNPTGQCLCKGDLFGKSVADQWTIWLGATKPDACIITELVKAGGNCVPRNPNYVMGNMIHVKTTYGAAGIVSEFEGKPKVSFSCWIYVVKGKVCVGVGNKGGTTCTVTSTTTCKWEKLQGVSTGSPANQIIIYAATSDAEYYVDNVDVRQ